MRGLWKDISIGLLLVLFCNQIVLANPTGPQVIQGQAQFNQPDVNTLNITNSAGAILHWQQFSIQQNETTRFIQPSIDSAVLNRVVGQDPSDILGQLLSNGRVFLINPNGIVFGPGSVIDTAGLVASTLNMTDADFMTGTYRFEGSDAGVIQNRGYIKAGVNGDIFLIAPNIENSGIIETQGGKLILAAGQSVTLASLDSDDIVFDIQAPDNEVVNLGSILTHGGAAAIFAGTIQHSGTINADSIRVDTQGRVQLYAQENITIDTGATISAEGPQGGSIDINAQRLYQLGDIHADGDAGGTVGIQADKILQTGQLTADGESTKGGSVSITGNEIIQTTSAIVSAQGSADDGTGGTIDIRGDGTPGSSLFSSASIDASGDTGGRIVLTSEDVILRGTNIDASGDSGGGQIFLGGGWQGNSPFITNSQRVDVNFSNTLSADATTNGNGGFVIVWSDEQTRFMGEIMARGGEQGGNGGFIEVSGKNELVFGGTADAGAPNGEAGMLLLDPKNVIVDAAGSGGGGGSVSNSIGTIDLVDPNIGAGDLFADNTIFLYNDNIIATDPNDDFSGTDAGAVYLYDGTTGALISALNGASAGDQLGNGSIYRFSTTDNFLVINTGTDIGGQADVGSVTFGTSTGGVSGVVSATNSLVGSVAGDQVGSSIQELYSTGKYLVRSPNADVGGVVDAGAVSFGDTNTGLVGAVSASNSLVGGAADDKLGGSSVRILSNGNYLVSNSLSDIGGMVDAGSVTFGDGTTGVTGVVSATNSLVGSVAGDQVGIAGIRELSSTGKYLVRSPNADVGGVVDAGAISFGDSNTGLVGAVSASNSLVGGAADDRIGDNSVRILNNGNYLVSNPLSDIGGMVDAGSVTFGDGTTGVTGVISASNSLVGGAADDQIGNYGIIVLSSSSNYLVLSPNADIGGITDAGAVTFGDGTTGITGAISASNSLVGGAAGDQVGSYSITQLYNTGNYLVRTPTADIGGLTDAGAVTLGSGTTGVTGVISSLNSLVGGAADDQIGASVTVLSPTGNYLVVSTGTDVGGLVDAGSVTFGDATMGVTGVVSASNSLVGSAAGDQIGEYGIYQMYSTGSYMVVSPHADIGGNTDAGAVTFGDGVTGVSGIVSASNSLVGGAADDQVGLYGVYQLYSTDNYLVVSPYADIGGNADAGAVTFGDGTTGITGVISASNSLVGGAAGDTVGLNGIYELYDSGNYLVVSAYADIGGLTDAGAVTFGDGNTGVIGVISASNSLVGGAADDQVGSSGVIELYNTGNYLVSSPNADIGGITDAGAVTFGNGTTGITGVISSSNSLVGGSADDRVGDYYSINQLSSTGNYLVLSPNVDIGGNIDAGAVTFGDSSTGITGVISASNSLVGGAANDQVGSYSIRELYYSGNYLVITPTADIGGLTDAGAVTFGSGMTGVTGVISSSNSLVGGAADDQVGSYSISELSSSGNYLVSTPAADIGGNLDAGAVTFGDSTTGVTGVISASNSLVGGAANDQIGNGGIIQMYSTGNYLVRSPDADISGIMDAGAVTFGDGTTGISGVISASNSLVGGAVGDSIGSGITTLYNGNYVVVNPLTDVGGLTDAGSVTFISSATGVTGVVSATNSLVGGAANDQIGSAGIFRIYTNGNYLVRSPDADIGGITDAGALTFGSGTAGVTGVVSATNSLVGGAADDRIGGSSIITLNSLNYVVVNTGTDIDGLTDAGSITFIDKNTGVTGVVSADNSLVGGSTNDNLGSGGITPLTGDNFLVESPLYDNGAIDSGRLQIAFPGSGGGGGGGSGSVSLPLLFADIAASDVTVTPLQITTITNTGTAVTLQASNDMTINSAIITSNGSGTGGALTLQAGRSVTINANITTDDGDLTITANETAANGVIDANRDSGLAVITMADGTTLDAGTGNIIITLSDGAGLTNSSAGDVTLANLIAGDIDITLNSPTNNSDILRSSASSLIKGNSLFIDHDPFGGSGGSIGTSTQPLRVEVGSLSAHTHDTASPGVFIDSPNSSQNVVIGNSFFGQFHLIQGVETVSSGDIVLNIAGGVTVNAPVLSTGTLSLDSGAGLSVNSEIDANGDVSLTAGGSLLMTDVSVNGNNIQLSGSTVELLADLTSAQLDASGNLDILSSGNILIQGSDIVSNGSAKMTVAGAVTIDAVSLTILGGAADFAPAGIDPTSLDLTLSGDLNLTGGAGNMSEAILAGNAVTMAVTSDVILTGGAGSDSFALINGVSGDVNLTAGSLTMNSGTGSNADAAIVANTGSGSLITNIGICNNCDVLILDPLSDSGAQSGFFGNLSASTTEAPTNQQVIVLNDYTFSDLVTFVAPEQQQDEEEEDILKCN